mgnify:CR=1 FL=1
MGILEFISKICVQPAVYWGNPIPNGYGGYNYDSPIQIYVRWDDSKSAPSFIGGDKITVNAIVLCTQELDLGGFLWLGELPEYPEVMPDNPLEVENAYSIQKFTKVPLLKSKTLFVKTAYL